MIAIPDALISPATSSFDWGTVDPTPIFPLEVIRSLSEFPPDANNKSDSALNAMSFTSPALTAPPAPFPIYPIVVPELLTKDPNPPATFPPLKVKYPTLASP